MDNELRRRLADRAFLFDDPNAYLAGIDAALNAVAEQRPVGEDRRVETSSPQTAFPRR